MWRTLQSQKHWKRCFWHCLVKSTFLPRSRKCWHWDFPGNPVVKIPHFQCRGWEGSTPGPETEIPHATECGPKPKTKSTQSWFSRNIYLSEWKRNRQQTRLNKGTRKGQRISTRKEIQQGKTNRGITWLRAPLATVVTRLPQRGASEQREDISFGVVSGDSWKTNIYMTQVLSFKLVACPVVFLQQRHFLQVYILD